MQFVEKALNSGAIFYIAKPFTIDELSSALKYYLDIRDNSIVK